MRCTAHVIDLHQPSLVSLDSLLAVTTNPYNVFFLLKREFKLFQVRLYEVFIYSVLPLDVDDGQHAVNLEKPAF